MVFKWSFIINSCSRDIFQCLLQFMSYQFFQFRGWRQLVSNSTPPGSHLPAFLPGTCWTCWMSWFCWMFSLHMLALCPFICNCAAARLGVWHCGAMRSIYWLGSPANRGLSKISCQMSEVKCQSWEEGMNRSGRILQQYAMGVLPHFLYSTYIYIPKSPQSLCTSI